MMTAMPFTNNNMNIMNNNNNNNNNNNSNNTVMFSKAGLKRPRSSMGGMKRSVCFSTEPPMATTVPSREEQDRDNVWYNEVEYDRFKSEAKQSAYAARAQLESLVASSASAKSTEDLDANLVAAVVPRGVEHRISLARSKRKYMALRAVLDTQRRLQSEMTQRRVEGLVAAGHITPEVAAQAVPSAVMALLPASREEVASNGQRLGNISTKFTRWAARNAVVAAARDAREAREEYQPTVVVPPTTQGSNKRKEAEVEDYASDSDDSVGPGGINVKRRRISATRHTLLEACCDVTLLEPIPVF